VTEISRGMQVPVPRPAIRGVLDESAPDADSTGFSRETSTRETILESAVVLFREQGVAETSIRDVIDHSGATLSTVFHHFPQGKDQLAAEATERAGVFMASLLASVATDDPEAAVAKFVNYWTMTMRSSSFQDGCPAAAATLATATPSARRAAGAAFGHWEELVTRALTERGHRPDEAASLATLIIAAIEGALILARAQESNEPLRKVGLQLSALLLD